MLQKFEFSRVYFIFLFHLTTSQIIFLSSFSFSLSCTYLENFTFLGSHPQNAKFPQVLLVCKAVLLARRPVCALETLMTIPLDSFALWLLS